MVNNLCRIIQKKIKNKIRELINCIRTEIKKKQIFTENFPIVHLICFEVMSSEKPFILGTLFWKRENSFISLVILVELCIVEFTLPNGKKK